jgi:hypothetical protein
MNRINAGTRRSAQRGGRSRGDDDKTVGIMLPLLLVPWRRRWRWRERPMKALASHRKGRPYALVLVQRMVLVHRHFALKKTA